jgi:putative component of membrane protein insertase Oxa1/YidC/SpoIIIJ protein YidD
MEFACSDLELRMNNFEFSSDNLWTNLENFYNTRTAVPESSIFLKSDKELAQYENSKSLDRKIGMIAIRYLWTKSGASKTYAFVFGRCPMEPHCSNYGYEAIAEHGLIKGSIYSFRRTLRCNPMGWKQFPLKDGRVYDPVPKED